MQFCDAQWWTLQFRKFLVSIYVTWFFYRNWGTLPLTLSLKSKLESHRSLHLQWKLALLKNNKPTVYLEPIPWVDFMRNLKRMDYGWTFNQRFHKLTLLSVQEPIYESWLVLIHSHEPFQFAISEKGKPLFLLWVYDWLSVPS